jgi:Flp pilus assembly protein protease CpaA
MILGLLSVIICIVGLVIFFAARNPGAADVKRIGFTMFWVGLLAFLMTNGTRVVHM